MLASMCLSFSVCAIEKERVFMDVCMYVREIVCVLTLNLKLRAKKSSFIKRLSIFYCRNKIARKKYLVDQSNFCFGQFFGSVAKTLPTFD